MGTSLRFAAEALERLACDLFTRAGTPAPIARVVAGILVRSNLTGHDSHGILRIPHYLEQIEQGRLIPAAEPVVQRETAAAALVDAQRGFGHYAAREAMALAIRKAQAAGAAAISLVRCNHIGRLGEYAEQAAAAGCVGIVTSGFGGPGTGLAAPPGSAEVALGTNPIAIGVPTGDDTPFVLDFATTVIAEGKIQVARSKGELLPEGCILDREGRPSVSPADFYAGGSLRFAGGHKGYALSLATCLFGALGGGWDHERRRLGGVLLQAIDPGAFGDRATYAERVREFLAGIRALPPLDPAAPVIVPGVPERAAFRERSARGIEVPLTIWQSLEACAARWGVELPAPLAD